MAHPAWLPFGMIVFGCVLAAGTARPAAEEQARNTTWTRHTIDASSQGADGVRLADVNRDGLPDITTGWEQGGRVRVYLHPGHSRVRGAWPAVTVGEVRDVEDAVFADLDGDRATDVASCCEGTVRTLFVHWAPKDRTKYLDPAAWSTAALPASRDMMQWMFCLPMQVDGKNGLDLVAGGKNRGARIGWYEAPEDARTLSEWKWHPLRPAGWIMSLLPSDMDGDGDEDVVASDRKGPLRGCFWLENPGPGQALAEAWKEHPIGGGDREVMFLSLADLDRDGMADVVAAAKPQELLFFRRRTRDGTNWDRHSIPLPPNTGNAKAVNVGDINLDGKPDLVFTCEGASMGKSGVMWMSGARDAGDRTWTGHEISGPDGVKHDLVELLDLDGDQDLDVLTCEETKNLGVFWYENPSKGAR
jgi:VCBS repeat protein